MKNIKRAVAAMVITGFLISFGGILPTNGAWAESAKRNIVVIVNANNPSDSIAMGEVTNIFLGKKRVWDNGELVKTCDLVDREDEESSARSVFAGKYLGKDLASLKSYWVKNIFSGKGQPPISLKSPAEVVDFVAKNRGAIGYLYMERPTESVKILRITGLE